VPRWQEAYAALSGERYRELIAYARLLTGAEDPTERVATALHGVLSRGRRVPGADAVAAQVREALARDAATAGAQSAGAQEEAPPDDAAVERALRVLSSPYAPPLADDDRWAPGHADPADNSEHPDSCDGDDERAALETALAGLDPAARTAVVLHEMDGLGVQRIAEITRLGAPAVVAALRRAHRDLVADVGLAMPPDPGDEPLAQAELTVITTSTDGRRHA